MTENTLQIQRSKPVRISLPASVAYNVEALQKSIAEIVDRLGCTRCFSGADCVFQLERDWVVNEKLQFSARGFARAGDPSPQPSAAALPAARVGLAARVAYNLSDIQKVVAEVAGRLGHPQCFSGFDVGFGLEQQLVLNAKGQLAG
jgi:hypothetical protein